MKVFSVHGVISSSVLMLTPMWVAAQAITSFTVVNADTGADIGTFTTSATVSRRTYPNINVRANASNVGSVVFTDSTGPARTENDAPYAYKGNSVLTDAEGGAVAVSGGTQRCGSSSCSWLFELFEQRHVFGLPGLMTS